LVDGRPLERCLVDAPVERQQSGQTARFWFWPKESKFCLKTVRPGPISVLVGRASSGAEARVHSNGSVAGDKSPAYRPNESFTKM
jgi:hypothetical protein